MGELILLIGVVALIGGPTAVMKLAKMVKSVHRAKSELTGKAVLDKIMDPGEAPKKKKKKRKRRRQADK